MFYFDNAATTFPKPEKVYREMDNFSRNFGVSFGRGQHKLSSKASMIADETRALLLELMHCSNKKVVFTHTATEAINTILFGIKYPSGSCVYISPFEHNAVTRTLHFLSEKYGFEIKQLAVNKSDYSFNLNKIKIQFEESNPYCVIISHASNVVGTIAPIKDIFILSKQYCAINIADMCQTAGLIDTNISSNIFDFIVFAGHKTLYGPLGVSGFISSFNIDIPPLIYGGTGMESAIQDMPNEIPVKYEAGSHNTVAIAGLNASLKWIMDVGIENIRNKEIENTERLINLLKQYDNIKIIKPNGIENNIGVVSCVFDNYSSDNIGYVLSENNIAVRSGLHCAPLAHKFIGTFPSGTVRFSVSYFNNDLDFEALINALEFIEMNS